MGIAEGLRRQAVQRVKPHLSAETWSRLRRLGGAGATSPAPAPAHEDPRLGMDLTGLAQEFGTDKWGAHRYTPHYQRHLARFRDRRFTLLEIGIGGADKPDVGGESLRMWKWFFPQAEVVGLDIFDKSFVDEPRVHTYQGSQVDPGVLERIIEERGAPLVVIDDGSHRPEHVRETFRLLFPLLPDGAVYAIEDIQTSYWPQWHGSLDRDSKETSMGLVKQLVDGLNYEEFLDEDYQPSYTDTHVVGVHCYHNLVFIEKGDNREGTNKEATLRWVAERGLDA